MPASPRASTMPAPNDSACPCGMGRYMHCCGPLHEGMQAASAEALMRSRYSAYVLNKRHYLLQSWHASTRPHALPEDNAQTATWLGLSIKAHQITGPDTAEVEFVARFRQGGASAQRMRERSRFVRQDGHWYYLNGDIS